MTGLLRPRSLGLLLAIAVAAAADGGRQATAQSLLAGRGLGVVAEPLDARARGLGGIGLGFPEPNLSLVNPASVAGLLAPALHVTYQPDRLSTEFGGATTDATTARFPLLHVALPIGGRTVVSLGFGSFLDQNWAVQRDTSIEIGGESVRVVDRFSSRGGVARLRVGGAYSFSEEFAVGAGLDVHTGALRDTISRVFEVSGIAPTFQAALWSYSGLSYTAGARWVPSEALALGAAISRGGTLEATADDPAQTGASYQLPLTASFGGSGRVTPTTLVALAGRWSGWSAADDGLAAAGGARDSWSVGGGIEWEGITAGERVFPFRLGGRYGTLPFAWEAASAGAGWLTERAVTGGAGVRLAGGAAVADLALERGQRSGDDAGFRESFWRLALSLTVLGR